ncbi:unnamed protein product, partial [marine sediment metagenome]
ILFLAFSISLFIDRFSFLGVLRDILGKAVRLSWAYRTPASLFLLSLLSGIDKQSEMKENV